MGLYLEQATKYICRYLSPILETPLTASMISNYVKRGLLSSPVRKQYSRDQVAYLFFIAVAKNVLSLDALACFLRLQERTYPLEKPMITSAGSWKTSCCSSLRSGRPLNPPTRIPPTKSGCSTAARRRWCRRFTWKMAGSHRGGRSMINTEAVSRRMKGYRFFVSLSANSFPERLTFPVVCGIIGQLNQKTPDIREVFIHDAIQNP